MELEDYFKTPTQEEIDRQWLTQLCYDGQMSDDEIEEHVNAVIKWSEKRVKNNVGLADVVYRRELLIALIHFAYNDTVCVGKEPEEVLDLFLCN